MTRLGRQIVNSVAVLAIALGLGTTVFAQGRAAKRAARRARTAAVKTAPKTVKRSTAPARAAKKAARTVKPINLAGKRDPFVALVNKARPTGKHLPPGKAGLVIGTLTVQGTVQDVNGMIAVISNPDQRVYFVREGDRLYDGIVEKITLDGVTFQQNTKDAFGKPIERTVTKRIYASAGEQQ